MGVISKQLIKATDENLARPNKELIVKIITYLEENPGSNAEAADTLKERFDNVNAKVQMFA